MKRNVFFLAALTCVANLYGFSGKVLGIFFIS